MRAPRALLLALLVPLLLLSFSTPSSAQEPYMLHMANFTYLPDPLTVPSGVTVYAMNFDAEEPHSVTSSTDRSLFDVTNIPGDGSPHPFTAPTMPGSYPYYCIYHGARDGSGMAGTLVVAQAGAMPSPTPSPSASPSPNPSNDTPVSFAALTLGVVIAGLLLRRR